MANPRPRVTADDSVLDAILDDANHFVQRLRLPPKHHHLYDDIVQDTMIVAHERLDRLCRLDAAGLRGWTISTVFLVARNTQRAELRRTAAWVRLRDAFQHATVRGYFDQPDDEHADQLYRALAGLSQLDRTLIIGQVWEGRSVAELAAHHGLTLNAVRHRLTRARATARKNFEKV